MNDIFASEQSPRHPSSARDFDDYTTISVRLGDDVKTGIKQSNLEVVSLLKKLNIRSMINFYDEPIDNYRTILYVFFFRLIFNT